jgi:hypothetical protein
LARVVRAKYKKGSGRGHFEPIEPVDLAEDEVVEVIVPEVRKGDRDRFLRSTGTWKDLVPRSSSSGFGNVEPCPESARPCRRRGVSAR